MKLSVFFLVCASACATAQKDHGIVYPRLLTARGEGGQKVLKITENIALSLEKSQVFAGDFLLICERKDDTVHYYMNHVDYEQNLYHDEEKQASLMLDTEDGVKVEGIISDKLRIKPLIGLGRSEEGHIPHSLYEIEPNGESEPGHRDYAVGNTSGNTNQSQYLPEARSSKDILYPEVHIVVDYAYGQEFNFDRAKITHYLAILVNAANQRYKSIHNPKIQLRIVGVTVWEEEEPYLVIPGSDRNLILDEETLRAFNDYYKDKREFQRADLMFMITGRDMVFYENSELKTWVGGYSFIAGICQSYKVGMSEDRATSFYGVYVLAHEIGHSLGCVHDGSPAESHVQGHKGSQQCPWTEGYIMSYEMKDKRQYQFSECCQKDIRNLISQSAWACLLKKEQRSIKWPGYPGQHTSGDNYCKRVYYDIRGIYYDKQYGVQNCKVRCQGPQYHYTIGVVDGAPCDKDRKWSQWCMLGECVNRKK